VENKDQDPVAMGGIIAGDAVLLQILIEEGVLSRDCRLVCSGWARAVESRIEIVHVSHVDFDGTHLGKFLRSLPKLGALALDKRFRMAHIRAPPEQGGSAGGAVGGCGEERRGVGVGEAGNAKGGDESEQLQRQQHTGTVREREHEMIKAACAALKIHCPPELSASFCRLSVAELESILNAVCIGTGGSLSALDLSGNFFGVEGTRLLCTHGQSLLNVASLDLSSNDLKGTGVLELASCKELCAGLKKLAICENSLGPSDAPAVATLLESASRLTWLNLGKSDMKSGYDQVFSLLAHSRQLATLKLRGSNLQQDAGCLLSGVLAHSSSLTDLEISKNSLNHVAAEALTSAISSNQGCELKRLDISRNCLGPAGATAFAEMLQGAKRLTITWLDMSENLIRPDGSMALAVAIRSAAARPLSSLMLSSNAIGPIGANALAKALNGGGLRHLDVSNNSIDAEGAAKICAAAALCSQLCTLNIAFNRTGYDGVVPLEDSLLDWQGGAGRLMQLTVLDVSYNDIGSEPGHSFEWLKAAWKACPSLGNSLPKP
jgi:Ran GTPase-activating protein (RanGAP) involved in mRNA processing and transport